MRVLSTLVLAIACLVQVACTTCADGLRSEECLSSDVGIVKF